MEEVQKFYSTSITDVSDANATAIALIYHKVVSRSQLDRQLCVIDVKATIADFLLLFFFLALEIFPLTAELLWRLCIRRIDCSVCRHR